MCENNENEFEGIEKHILINFISGVYTPNSLDGCRKLSYDDLSNICEEVQCNILSRLSNDYFDSYILSESSLFVYPLKIVLMTCGSTTILKAIDLILKLTNNKLMLIPSSIIYYRNKLMFEDKQLYPHQSIEQELDYLKNNCAIQQNNCNKTYTNILGDINSDYLLITQNTTENFINPNHSILKIMMFDIDNEIAQLFYKCEAGSTKVEKLIRNILPKNIKIDEYYFTPCGFSLNAIIEEYYYTIHITPNSGCSYVSFETNYPIKNYQYVINNVINTFLGKKIIINFINTQNIYFEIDSLDNYSKIIPVENNNILCSKNMYCSMYVIS
jgi:S-adenosylmethionine decarboxylase